MLDPELDAALERRAEVEGVSKAELLRRYGVAVLDGHVAWTPEEAVEAAKRLPGPVYVVKSQIHAGGRGAGRFKEDPGGKGGVRVVKSVEEVRAQSEKGIPLGRYGTAEEFGKVAAFLASGANTYVTGQNFLVDGGMVRAI